ncbi:hypothetical protein SLS54_001057 [Diplodia seriata]
MPLYIGGPVYAQQPQQHQPDVRPLSRYGGDTSRSSPSHDARLPADDVQLSADVDLVIRQQPKEALVTVDGKEKARIRHYMQSPYLIMIADLWHPEENEANPEKALSGTICSSLHRLKDVDNKGKYVPMIGTTVAARKVRAFQTVMNFVLTLVISDGAFFVFGDISIKQQGEHRLRFSLFDIHKYVPS